MSILSEATGDVVASGITGSLRCGNPDCNEVVAQAHMMGLGFFRVLCCPRCHRGTEYENTSRGWTVRLLPKRAVAPQQVKR